MQIRCGLAGIDTEPWTDSISYTTNVFLNLTYDLFQVVITYLRFLFNPCMASSQLGQI
jgi:hypothetical protein